jgi:hypothetical protein
MSYEEFAAGYKAMEPEVSEKMIKQAFNYGDSDGQNGLSWDEFKSLYA